MQHTVRSGKSGLMCCALAALVMAVAVTSATASLPDLSFVAQYGGTSEAVHTDGTYVYLAQGPRLLVLDMSNPAAPSEVGRSAPLPRQIMDVFVAGGYAYLATDIRGFRVLSLANLAQPVEVGFLDSNDASLGVFVAGDVAYVADRYAGLSVVSIADPSNPVRLSVVDTPGRACKVFVRGNLIFVADGSGGLRVISIVNPASPAEIGAFEAPNDAVDVTVRGDHAFVVDRTFGLRVVSIADPSNPVEVGSLGGPDSPSSVVAISDDVVVVGDQYGGVAVISVADRHAPVLLARFSADWDTLGMTPLGTNLYVAAGRHGVRVVSLADPTDPQELGAYDTAFLGMHVAARGNLVFLVDPDKGLHIISVADPESPQLLAIYDEAPGITSVDVAGNHVYLGTIAGQVVILDVSNPVSPQESGRTTLLGDEVLGVRVLGGYAYVVCGFDGLKIVSVHDPAQPTVIGSVSSIGFASDVDVCGGMALVAAGGDGLRSVSVADPEHPAALGQFIGTQTMLSVACSPGYAYPWDNSRLYVVSVSETGAMEELSSHQEGLRGRVALVGDYAVAASGWVGALLFSLEDKENLTRLKRVGLADSSWDVAVAGDLAFVADEGGGLFVLRMSGIPIPPADHQNYWLQVAARGPGAQGSQWRTDLGLFNPGDAAATAQLRYHASGGVLTREQAVAPGEQLILVDVVGLLGGSGSAALQVVSDRPLKVSSRTYNLLGPGADCAPSGTFGQNYDAFTPDQGLGTGQSAWLTQLTENADYRTNIALTNMSSAEAKATVELFDGAGGAVGSYNVTLNPGQRRQEDRVFFNRAGQSNLARGYARVTVTEGAGVLASASVVDNVTSDPTTMPMLPAASAASLNSWVQVASHAPGLNQSQWRTDLGVLNPGGQPAVVQVRFHKGSSPKQAQVTLAPGQQAILADVVDQIPESGSAALQVVSTVPVVVSSRTYNQVSADDQCFAGGTFGQNYDAFTVTTALQLGDVAHLTQLQENDAYRTNIALTNTGEVAARVEVVLFDGEGAQVGQYTANLNPGQYRQETRPFFNRAGQDSLAAGYARVRVLEGSGIIASASVVDEQTNDPTTMPALR